ncbi:MAG: pseudouridine synthase [Deferrisomatales bacterium]
MAAERLQKLLSGRGLCSRREAEAWILAGRVAVNGEVVRELGTRADPEADRVEVDGEPLPGEQATIVVLLNKPAGYDTTVRDPHAERTVMELLTGVDRRVYPVGRLDRDTRGVLLFTDDGDLAHHLLHPSRGVEKIYEAQVAGRLDEAAFAALASGVELYDGRTAPARVWEVGSGPGEVRLRLALREGRKRQVRRMVQAVGGRVNDLVRLSFGGITADGVEEGRWRLLRADEVRKLRSASEAKHGAERSPVRVRPAPGSEEGPKAEAKRCRPRGPR